MSDEVYEGAIGIDLGAHTRMSKITPQWPANFRQRHNLLLRCQLRGHQCRDQYAPTRLSTPGSPSNNLTPSCQRAG